MEAKESLMSEQKILDNVSLMRKNVGIVWPGKSLGKVADMWNFNIPRDSLVTYNYIIKPDLIGPPCSITLYPEGKLLNHSPIKNEAFELFIQENAGALLNLAVRLKTVTTIIGKLSIVSNPRRFVVYYTVQDNVVDVSPNCTLNFLTDCLVPQESTEIIRFTCRSREVLCNSIPRAWIPDFDLIAFPTYSDELSEAKIHLPMIEVLGFRLFKGHDPWKTM